MSNITLFFLQAENIGKRQILAVAMKDMRLIGNTDLHLKYLEMYESLKAEYKELEYKELEYKTAQMKTIEKFQTPELLEN